jgi:predicted nucleotidyltransferase
MARPDARAEAQIVAFTGEVRAALGDRLVALVLHGSAAGDDWVAGRSDVNTAIVVPRLDVAMLEMLAPLVARWRERGFALPVLMDREYLAGARDTFPMELDDIRRQHRLLAGEDVFADLVLDPRALRRECEYDARGKLLRLRALFLETFRTPAAIENLMAGSVKSFLIVLRHLLRLRGADHSHGYDDVLAAGEAELGPLPTMRAVLAHRSGTTPLDGSALRARFGAYLAEVERIVEAVDALDD